MSVAEREPRRWTVDEYYRLAESGFIAPDERVELIEGEILSVSPQKSPHAVALTLCSGVLQQAFGAGWVIRVQSPIRLAEDSEPEPDLAVVAGEPRDYLSGHPVSAALLVEIADTTLRFDLGRKAQLYSGGGIPEYWVLSLPERKLVVHRDPDRASRAYRGVTRWGSDQTVSPLAASEALIAVADLLP
jgi:Uma2 family endonuclease